MLSNQFCRKTITLIWVCTPLHCIKSTAKKSNRGKGSRGSTQRQTAKRLNQSFSMRDSKMGPIMKAPRFGFPDKMITTLRYHDFNNLNSTTGTVANYLYRLNSVFDPDFTSTGHQPMYRDLLATIYDHYAVISTKAIIKFVNTSTTISFICGCIIDDDSTIDTNRDALCEQTHGEHVLLPPLAGSLSSHTFIQRWDVRKYLGIDPFTSETYKTSVGSNPTDTSFLGIWGVDAELSATATISFDIELEFTVLWTELQTPGLS